MKLASAAGMRRALARVSLLALAACASRAAAQGGDAAADVDPQDAATDDNASDAGSACAPYGVDGSSFDDGGCTHYMLLPCGLPEDASVMLCGPDYNTCEGVCGPSLLLSCTLAVVTCNLDAGLLPDANVIIECSTCPGDYGRRPRGLVRESFGAARTSPGDYFAAMAHLEAASVPAFRELARSLAHHQAPGRLVREARRAAQDEQRHARAATRLARRFGGDPKRPRLAATREPTLESLLAHDAIEGCVAETYAALVASWQASRAKDARIARTLTGIAKDEARHASLAWSILAWGAPRLDAAARARLHAAIDRALLALEGRASRPVAPKLRDLTGHPSPREARALATHFARTVRAELAGFSATGSARERRCSPGGRGRRSPGRRRRRGRATGPW